MIFIDRRICRLLDRRENVQQAAPEATSLCADDTQKPDDETTAGGALSAAERLLAHGISLPTDREYLKRCPSRDDHGCNVTRF